jgi:hypothetical protein
MFDWCVQRKEHFLAGTAVTLLLSDTVLSQPRVRYTECVYMEQVVFYGAEHHPSVHERNRLAHILGYQASPNAENSGCFTAQRILESPCNKKLRSFESRASQIRGVTIGPQHPSHRKSRSGFKYSIESRSGKAMSTKIIMRVPGLGGWVQLTRSGFRMAQDYAR